MSTPISVYEDCQTFLGDQEGVLAVLRVFFDESGTHRDSSVVTVGAAFARPTVWKKWTAEWNAKKRPIAVHHSTDCHNRQNEYEGWSRKERDDYVKRLLPVIPEFQIQGRISGIHLASFQREIAHRPDVQKVFGNPYGAVLQWAVFDICETAKKSGHSRLTLLHENNNYLDEATRAFAFAKRKFFDMKITFGFGSKKDFVPLQCADVLAFEGNRRLRDTTAPWRKPLELIDPTAKNIGYIDYDETDMPEFVRFMCRAYDERSWAKPDQGRA